MTATQSPPETIEIRPQSGPQTAFLATPADIAIYGGAAGGGKSFALLLEPLRHIQSVDGFGAVVFRRTVPQITAGGGLWDESEKLYSLAGGIPRQHVLEWEFPPYRNAIKFSHLEYDKNVYDWQGAQVALIEFDELTHFTEKQFFYLLSRNRSICGVNPYVRATTNPDADSWVAAFIDWWIDDDGFPIPDRAGVLRWFVRINDEIRWADTAEELHARYGTEEQPVFPTSVTFIPARLVDNPILMEKDPTYRAKLDALPLVERERLKEGNWKIRAAAGLVFRREWFGVVPTAPREGRTVRYWDLAATEPGPENRDPDHTVGFLLNERGGRYTICDLVRVRRTAGAVRDLVRQTAELDGQGTWIRMEQEPGSSGKAVIASYKQLLAGYNFAGIPSTGDKVTRAGPASSAAEQGMIDMVLADWNAAFLHEVDAFPNGAHDDIVDGFTGAYNELALRPQTRPRIGGGITRRY